MAAITKVAYTVRAKRDFLLQLFYITMTTTTITLSELHTCTLVMYFCRVCCKGGMGSFGSDAWLWYICPGLNLSLGEVVETATCFPPVRALLGYGEGRTLAPSGRTWTLLNKVCGESVEWWRQ